MKGLLVAVEPNESVVVAHWSLRDLTTEADVVSLKSRLERKVGPRFVIIDTRLRPEWEQQITGASQSR